jgi:hypothetical protein
MKYPTFMVITAIILWESVKKLTAQCGGTDNRYPIPARTTSIEASITASLTLQGRIVVLHSVAYA